MKRNKLGILIGDSISELYKNGHTICIYKRTSYRKIYERVYQKDWNLMFYGFRIKKIS